MYMGLYQQLRDNGLDELSDQYFGNPASIPGGDISIPANQLVQARYPYASQIQYDIQWIVNQSFGREDETYRQVLAMGGDDQVHAGGAGSLLWAADGSFANGYSLARKPAPKGTRMVSAIRVQ